MRTKLLLVAACLAFGGCTTLTDYGVVRQDHLRNDQGQIIGTKELLRNERTGEVVAQVAMFTPLRSESGEIVGYEEQARSGSIIRDLDGNRIAPALRRPAQPRHEREGPGPDHRLPAGRRAEGRRLAAQAARPPGVALGVGSAPDPVIRL